MKNTMLIPLLTIPFFFVDRWIYFAFPNGPFIYQGQGPTAVTWIIDAAWHCDGG